MSVFLARSISMAKWKGRDNIAQEAIPADGVTADMKTSSNVLSFWVYDPAKEGSLENVVLALATTRQIIQKMDLAWIDEEQIKEIELLIRAAKGQTAAHHLEDNHRDVVGIDLKRLCGLAHGVARAVSGDQNRRFTEKQIRGLLVRAAKERLISLDELHAEVAEKVRNDIEA